MGNIKCNKGEGIKIYAQFDDGENKEYKLLATFDRNEGVTAIDNPEIKDYYNIIANSAFFEVNGEGKGNARLYCDGEYLTFIDDESNTTDRFAISASDPVRAGDDFLLRFCLAYDPEVVGMVPPGDFVACYDKKLLWRANLYIDETLEEDGTESEKKDWNNENIWIVDNEWLGRQIELDEYLEDIYNIITPDEKAILNQYYTLTGDYYTLPQEITIENAKEINKIFKRINYRYLVGGQIKIKPWTHPNTLGRNIYNSIAYSYADSDVIFFNSKATIAPNTEDKADWTKYPEAAFIPSLYWYNHENPDNIKQGNNDLGLHCTQFRDSAWKYDHHPYVYKSYEVDINLLVPGDYISWGNRHIALVNKIEYNNDRETDRHNIRLIHSTVFSASWYVQNTQSLQYCDEDDVGTGKLERLKTKFDK